MGTGKKRTGKNNHNEKELIRRNTQLILNNQDCIVKVCYFITSYRNEKQLHRLVGVIRKMSPDSVIVVHHDFMRSSLDIGRLTRKFGAFTLPPSKRIIRGRYSCLIAIYLKLIDWLLTHDIEFDWVVNITESDYPVMNLQKSEEKLVSNGCDGFIKYWEVLGPDSPWSVEKAINRYWKRYWEIPASLYRYLESIHRKSFFLKFTPFHVFGLYGPFVGWPAKVPFNDQFKCYGGWPFFSISRKCIEYINDFVNNNHTVIEYYKGTMVPDESMIQTILVNSGKYNLCNDDKRYADYTGTITGSPRQLTVKDLPTIMTGEYHFARKFDISAGCEVLDQIDQIILK